jgi:hypothetical protein
MAERTGLERDTPMESVTYCIQRRANPLSTPMIPEFRTRFRTISKSPGPPPGPAEDISTSNPASLGATGRRPGRRGNAPFDARCPLY